MHHSASKQIHFVGIGSAGLAALARVMLARGWGVSGSDWAASPALAALARAGARVSLGHRAGFMNGANVVVVSSVTPADNPEVLAAQARGIPVLSRARWLAEMTRGAQCITVAGTQGKTTTTAMLALVLHDAGLDPTAVIGGEVPQFGGNALIGRRDFFVIEAGDGEDAFLGLTPTMALVTGVEPDHPDGFENVEAVCTAFDRLLRRVPSEGPIVALGDDPTLRALVRAAGRAPATFYGFDATNQWQAAALKANAVGGTDFVALKAGRPVAALRLRVAGLDSVLAALGATAVADTLDVPIASIQASLAGFTGVRRRFEPVGAVGGVQVFDDDAHRPGELRATLQAARQRFGPRPLWVVFQPHPGARPDDLAAAFVEANRVIVSAVSAAGEPGPPEVSGEALAARLRAAGVPAAHLPTQAEILPELTATLPDEAVVITLGGGESSSLGPRLLRALAQRVLEEDRSNSPA
ncbi:MAG: UDP-N-acetylmuramate--L-alanine ligase [Ardenticatenaceae bacterium]|nr:UDP-N-acetylmuramate--L-alanine ligase [Ardenticatenaceae bacterium]